MGVGALLLIALAGAISWTFAEYILHDFWGHRAKGKNGFSREHLAHHANTSYFTPTLKKTLAALSALAVVGPLVLLLAGWAAGGAFLVGFYAMYISYEVVHRRTHTHPPRGRYSRWARRHHLYHHFKSPKTNHGVTTPIWDMIFATYRKPGLIVVPRKQVMDWLCDEDGNVKREYTADYALKAPRRSREASAAETVSAGETAAMLHSVGGGLVKGIRTCVSPQLASSHPPAGD